MVGQLKATAFAAFVLLGTAAVAGPSLGAFGTWRAGVWQQTPEGGRAGAAKCLDVPVVLLLGGRADAACRFSVIANHPEAASVTYQCADGRQGRTEIRRDTADVYTVDAQGVEAGRPFADRSEWTRLGACHDRARR